MGNFFDFDRLEMLLIKPFNWVNSNEVLELFSTTDVGVAGWILYNTK